MAASGNKTIRVTVHFEWVHAKNSYFILLVSFWLILLLSFCNRKLQKTPVMKQHWRV